MVICAYCNREILGTRAKQNLVNGDYLHDGFSLSELLVIAGEMGYDTREFKMPVGSSEEEAERYRRLQDMLPDGNKLCSQLYKFDRVMKKGETVNLTVVELEDNRPEIDDSSVAGYIGDGTEKTYTMKDIEKIRKHLVDFSVLIMGEFTAEELEKVRDKADPTELYNEMRKYPEVFGSEMDALVNDLGAEPDKD